ncbi:MAG: HlyC/CorC family transporter [Candidatus Nitrosopumilus sp. MTA1]|uniref:HlyC/CorC family transporter n=1 Tax=Marine Group I thaumarchaeote TaxID=2511932 RepID=A0A7K4N628_9ARCH|nr:MAG: HlyC/CorC family transporter [Nitrosopumilus sp. YT1]NMI82812.1 HlyC/CorC family transporter [Candidatus Nitrosopumilus sp. MTA1]NWJ28808.1 HlyC/CorC family transporter [Marine Group I thaumarchaeote]NWJ83822.1 HlyC/CorC family transporter [Marine Group I thaumarchaeote]
MVDLWVELATLAVLIGLSGFFSGLEVALVGIPKSKVIQLFHEGKKGSKALHKLKTNPSWMMSSVNLGNNLVNVGASALATSLAIRLFGNDGLGIAVGVMTFLILVFGEITPKTYCNANSTKIALRFAPVLLAFSYVFYPVVKFFEVITRGVVKLTGSSYTPPPITEEDIKGVIDQGLAEKAIEKDEMKLVHRALKFDDTAIRSVMTPRIKMFTLNSKMLLFEALPQINQSGHSRIPIYGDTKEDIVGFIHARDILKELEKDNKMISLEQIARKPVFASQEKMVSSLLKEMQGRRIHIAIVIDEHNGVEGLVTLEDLVEEIVGEIEDETDLPKPVGYEKIDQYTIITNGDIEIDIINEIFKTNIPEGDDYASLNGLLHEKLKDIPQEGDKVELDELRIIVEKVSKNIPQKIRIERIRY